MVVRRRARGGDGLTAPAAPAAAGNARASLIVAGIGLAFAALLHVVLLAGGAGWIAFAGAPPVIVDSARAGTWLAPVVTLGIAVLLGLFALYAVSAAGYGPALPLRRPVLWSVAAVFVLRGLLAFPLLMQANLAAAFDVFHVVASFAVLAIGCLLAFGARGTRVRA